MVAVNGPDAGEEETKNHFGDDISAPSEASDSLSSTFDHALSTCKETLLQMLHDREFEEVKEKLLAIDSLKKTVNEAMKEASMAPAPRFSRAMLDASEVSQTEKAILSPDLWAITYDQLMHVDALAARLFGRSYSKKTMRDINKRMIEPLCKRTWTSYALSLNPLGLKLDVFITHSWDESFASFVDSIRSAFHTSTKKPNLWICSFALIQGNHSLLQQQLSKELSNAPFVMALKEASYFLVVRNSTTDLYSRIWCICELMYAKKFGLVPDKTHVTGPDVFSQLESSCLDAQASCQEDKETILAALQEEHDYNEIDEWIHQFRTFGEHPALKRDNSRNLYVLTGAILLIAVIAVIVAVIVGGQSDKKSPLDDLLPPSKAYDWVKSHPEYESFENWRKLQLFALATLQFAIRTPAQQWIDMDTPECEWNLGGSPPDCKNGMYQRIHLPEPRGGKILTEISLLSSLTSLDLSASLTPLELSALDRRFAPLIGTIPEEISFLTLLSELSLANNSLRGAVPTELSALTKLTKLRLENNLLTALPLEFGKFSHLVEMQVSQNNIVGTVPNELCQLAITGSLERLCVDCYRFECICCSCCRDTLLALFDSRSPDYRMIESAYAYLPVRIAAANPQAFDWWTQPAERQSTYSHDARFGRFALASIYFATGGENWTNTGNHRWLSHESACTWENYECNAVHHTAGLTLAYSNLVGTLPSEGLLYLPNMATVHLQANQLYGILPSEFAMMEKMTSLRLQQNQFSGTIPDELFAFASTNEAAQLGELQELYLDHNRLSGTIPNLSSFRSEEPNEASEEALLLFAERPFERLISIKELRLDNNQLSGPIPTFFGRFVNLEILTLHNNSLSGHVPFEVCGLFVIGSLKKLTIDCDLVQCDCQCECISAYSSAGDGASGNFSNT